MVSDESHASVASELDWKVEIPLTREHVIQCYKTILERNPENEEVVQGHLSAAESFWRLIERFIYSEEFKIKIGGARATRHDVFQAYKRILKRAPEDEMAYQHHLSGGTTHWELISRLVESEEHKKYIASISSMSLLKCIGRRYLANSFDDRDKYTCFFHHYAYLNQLMSPTSFQTMLKEHISLLEWCPQSSRYAVNLQANRELDNEGEIILRFTSESAEIYSLTFSIVPENVLGVARDGCVILISRMQGKPGKFADIRLATKEMGEISPQAILIAAIQGIALAIDIRIIAGVAAVNQLSFKEGESEMLERAYDQFFQSIDAHGPSNGFYYFEVPLQEKPIGPGHRGRKQLKREFKKEIVKTTQTEWLNAIGLNRSEAVSAPVGQEFEAPSAAEASPGRADDPDAGMGE